MKIEKRTKLSLKNLIAQNRTFMFVNEIFSSVGRIIYVSQSFNRKFYKYFFQNIKTP